MPLFTHRVNTKPNPEPETVQVEFRTKKLEGWYKESAKAQRDLGAKIARKYIGRVNIIKKAKSVDELSGLPGLRFHKLTGDRAGQYAINLDGFYRLHVTVGDEMVTIEEVSKHYGD